MKAGKQILRFGAFDVDVAAGELRKAGVRVKLQEQPFQALVALLNHPGEIVTRDELRQRLWPDTEVDFERGLNKAINRVREALEDDADNPRFIETVPQRGYRFLPLVETVTIEPVSHAARAPSRRVLIGAGLIGGSIATVSLASFVYRRTGPASQRMETIAVLPLENLSGDPAQEYFSDGMTDELIGEIGRTGAVHAISRTSVMRYKRATGKSLRQIAEELHAGVILEGTVAQSGRKVRINVRLIRAQDDRHLWSGTYERDLSEILAVQSEVARSVAREIQASLTPLGQSAPARKRAVTPEAYHSFLKGNYFIYQGIPGIPKAVDSYSEATKLDPGYPGGYAGLAEALVFSAIYGLLPSESALPRARQAALKALALDKSSAAAHNALADVRKIYDWDLQAAEEEYRLAVRLEPNHRLARMWYADCLSRMNRHDEALEQSNHAVRLDPVSPSSFGNRSMLLCRARRYDEALRTVQQALDLGPYFINARWWQGLAYVGKGDFRKAIEIFQKAAEMDGGPLFRALLGHACGLAGDRSRALRSLEEITQLSARMFVSPMDFAIVHAGLGDADSAFHWMEQAHRTRAARMHEIAWIYFDRFRGDARYPDLLRRVGLRPQA